MSDCCNNTNHSNHKTSPVSGPDTIYTCPMHPEIERKSPGMCPECGMALVPAKSRKKNGGHDKHEGHSTKMFLKKFWVSLALTIPLVAYSELPELFFGLMLPRFPGIDLVILALGSIVFFYGGWIFLTGAWREIKGTLPGMMTLIALAISAAYLWSIYATFTGEMTLFWELSTLIVIMLLGHWIEMKSVQGARGALKELAKLLPDKAEVLRNGKTEIVSISDLKAGDIVLVKPGAKVPADGKVIEGQSELDESIVTGESKPVEKKQNDEVIAGTINGDGSLKVEITKTGEETFLAGVMKMVEEAQASKSRLQILSDKAALLLTIIAVVAGSITLIAWLVVGQDVAFAVARLVAVLVIACPHALGLAVPLVASISTNMAAANGFIIKQRLALEAARSVEVVLFDKTGTLTKGEFGVSKVLPSSEIKEEEVLKIAASVNSHSEHPIAKAIVKDALNKKVELKDIKDFARLPGKGARGKIQDMEVLVGSETLVKEMSIEIEEGMYSKIKELESQGKTVIYVISENKLLGAIALEDIIREESREAINTLHDQGIKTAMITGDSEDVAKWVAKELKIDEYFAKVLPEEKAKKVKELQSRGQKVAMVGDGVNDAPALTQADLGIAIGAGTNVAIESAGIILVKNDPRDIPKITRLSKLTYSKMIQNLFWATGYNIIAFPLAAGAFVAFGIPAIDPAVGAIFMSASTVIVAINAVFLRRKEL
jgi:P-type Cu2+ transporter